MRTIKYTSRFKRDYRREKSGVLGKKLDTLLMEVVDLLATDHPLPRRHVDHQLPGEWMYHRDCHIRPDLVLIYRLPTRSTTNSSRHEQGLTLQGSPQSGTCPAAIPQFAIYGNLVVAVSRAADEQLRPLWFPDSGQVKDETGDRTLPN